MKNVSYKDLAVLTGTALLEAGEALLKAFIMLVTLILVTALNLIKFGIIAIFQIISLFFRFISYLGKAFNLCKNKLVTNWPNIKLTAYSFWFVIRIYVSEFFKNVRALICSWYSNIKNIINNAMAWRKEIIDEDVVVEDDENQIIYLPMLADNNA